MAVGVDVRSLERIVLWHPSVPLHAQNLAGQAAEVLGQRTIFNPTRRDIEMPVGADGDATAVVKSVTRNPGKQYARLSPGFPVEPRLNDLVRQAGVGPIGVIQVCEPTRLEVLGQRHAEKAASTVMRNRV